MAQCSRTTKVTINMVVGLLCQLVNVFSSFVARTYFIRFLGIEYLGVNGLFTNVLTVLSFAELGIGNAIVFSMYKPLAIHDEKKLSALIRLFRKAYTIIATVVLVAGICVIPFLDVLIEDAPDINENITLLYILFLCNTVASYFVTYKKAIITADQKNYIILTITEIIHVLQIAVQIVFLYYTSNYIGYLLIQICCTLLTNIVSSIVSDKMYPFAKNGTDELPKEERNKIFGDIKALAVYKFGSVILNGTDNILVSVLSNIVNVGVVSNYTLLSASCSTLLGRVVEAFTSSVGNMNTEADAKKREEVFNKIFFITSWLYGFVTIGLIVVSRDFIATWVGENYILDVLTCIALFSEFYIKGVHYAAYTYRTTLGYFSQGKISPVLAALLNIVLSFVLHELLGLCGIFFATSISRLLTTGIIDPILVYTKGFGKKPTKYFVMYTGYLLLFIILGVVCSFIINLIDMSGWLGVLVEIAIVTVIFNAIMCMLFCRTRMFRDLTKTISQMIRKILKKEIR